MLGSEPLFPQDKAVVGKPQQELRDRIQALHLALEEHIAGLTELRGELDRLTQELAPPLTPHLPSPARGEESTDLLIDRLEELQQGCEQLLKRQLRSNERAIIFSWAQLQRGEEEVATAEILQLVSRLLNRHTPDGTLPGGLAWCDSAVQTLARGAATMPRGAAAAAEFATLYEHLADQMEATTP